MNVRDVMNRTVISVRPETPLKEVARLMIERRVSGLPVVDEQGSVVGVVSETDLLMKERGAQAVRHRPLARLFGESEQAQGALAKVEAETACEAMTAPAITIEADRPMREAAAVMIDRSVNRLPVVEDGRLVGIVTRADLIRAYVRPDDELERTIREDVLLRELWIAPPEVDLTVSQGIVHLHGIVDRRSTAEIAERYVSRIEGVVAVESALTWRQDDREIKAPEPDLVGLFGRGLSSRR